MGEIRFVVIGESREEVNGICLLLVHNFGALIFSGSGDGKVSKLFIHEAHVVALMERVKQYETQEKQSS